MRGPFNHVLAFTFNGTLCDSQSINKRIYRSYSIYGHWPVISDLQFATMVFKLTFRLDRITELDDKIEGLFCRSR